MPDDLLIPSKDGFSNYMGGGGDETKTDGTYIDINLFNMFH